LAVYILRKKILPYIIIITIFIFSLNNASSGAGSNEVESIEVDNNPLEVNSENILKGKKNWRKAGCYSCHGGSAEGGVGPNLQDDVWIYKPTDKMLFKTIAKGRKGTVMVGWESELNNNNIWEIIVYIRSLYTGDENKIIW
jgi:cytochrome c(L)